MKHIISVPFMLDQLNYYKAEEFISKLKEVDADIVFLALDCYKTDKTEQEKVFASLRKYVPIFQKAGFKVGVWVWTFMVREKNDYVHITSPLGAVSKDQVCPSDEDFCAFACDYMQNIAKSKPDIIMFDDDFRYGFLDCGLGCACANHRRYMSEILGEEVLLDGLAKKVWSGKGNKYRTAWLKANGYFFKKFAERIRKAVDDVDDNIRIGICACITTWDFDSISAYELARIISGKTKPFLRLIGAPYWAVNRHWGNRVQDVIELERMESSWCKDLTDIDVFSECDAYPRPRFTCSANMLESFDMAMRASGATNGTHKYMLDYYADPDYETGYIEKHLKNQAIYRDIEKEFSDKQPVGIRVYEFMNKFENTDVPYYYDGNDGVQLLFFSPASRILATQSFPTVYEGVGTVGIAFGENARHLTDDALDNGLILDITAAKILEEKGVDVGLDKKLGELHAEKEYFSNEKRYVGLFDCPFNEISVKSGAVINSEFISDGKRYIGSYTYKNAKGQNFMVFAFDGYYANEHAFRNYARGRQINGFIKGIGKNLPAKTDGNPDCYMLCKENANGKAVWIGNFFSDECLNTTVILDKKYNKVKFINCEGTLKENAVTINRIGPWASVGFSVE